MVIVVPHAAVTVIVPNRAAPELATTYTLKLPLSDPDVGAMTTHGNDSETDQVEFEAIDTVWKPVAAEKFSILAEVVSKQPPEFWFTVMETVVPQAAVSVIIPVRAEPVLAVAFTFILLLFDPDVGVTVTHDKDSETDQVEFDEIFTF
ncbi:MAG: hypothetical protein FD155_1794 [Bacteroidetes bacterium]|nr:MAG: hypothetical protein FD155_1794 [Bacteroidota bacterium]